MGDDDQMVNAFYFLFHKSMYLWSYFKKNFWERSSYIDACSDIISAEDVLTALHYGNVLKHSRVCVAKISEEDTVHRANSRPILMLITKTLRKEIE